MYRLQPHKQMDVIRDATDFFRRSIESGNDSAEVGKETSTPCRIKRGFAIFCAEDEAAKKLEAILDNAGAAGMTHEAIQRERQGVAPYTVTSFHKLHGEKWKHACDVINKLVREIDFGDVFKRAEEFIDQNKELILAAMNKPKKS